MRVLRLLLLLFLVAKSAQASTFKVSLAMGGERFLKGEPVYCWIRYENDSTTDAFFLNQSSGASLEVTDARGSALDYVGFLTDEFITFSKFAPGESRVGVHDTVVSGGCSWGLR
jgi:hypothetical protein